MPHNYIHTRLLFSKLRAYKPHYNLLQSVCYNDPVYAICRHVLSFMAVFVKCPARLPIYIMDNRHMFFGYSLT